MRNVRALVLCLFNFLCFVIIPLQPFSASMVLLCLCSSIFILFFWIFVGSLCIFVVCVSLQSTVVFVMSLCGGLMSLCSYFLRISDDFATKKCKRFFLCNSSMISWGLLKPALLVPHSYHTRTCVGASMQCLWNGPAAVGQSGKAVTFL